MINQLIKKSLKPILLLLFFTAPLASAIEFMPFIGAATGQDLRDSNEENDLSLDHSANFGIAVNWQAEQSGQGQILINYIQHDYNHALDGKERSFDILYAHFNGVAHFQKGQYITTFSVGVGGGFFDANEESKVYPSLSAALGTRYQINQQLAVVTELRGYATWIDEDDNLFCENSQCRAHFDETLWLEGTVSFGIAYRF